MQDDESRVDGSGSHEATDWQLDRREVCRGDAETRRVFGEEFDSRKRGEEVTGWVATESGGDEFERFWSVCGSCRR